MNDPYQRPGELRRPPPPPAPVRRGPPPAARSLGTPLDFRRGPGAANDGSEAPAEPPAEADPAQPQATQGPHKQATEVIARRAGALIDEVDFVDFVAGLVHGTFDAVVDAS